ncbi:hypothetical protein Pint_18190 [Pistacia integerrima]|uniref:Uncharacterized protein n=1 Tax=Pistacia integerrima TaxID=434235 RepID=A0ACC0YYS6_9ROSI|nr:hypothetical protein Pint_18190 [Pistacia integerrima]
MKGLVSLSNSRVVLCNRMSELADIVTPSTDDLGLAGLSGSGKGGEAMMSVAETGTDETRLEGDLDEKLAGKGTHTSAKVLEVIRSQTHIVVGASELEKEGACRGVSLRQNLRWKDKRSTSASEDEDSRDHLRSPLVRRTRTTGDVNFTLAAGQEQGGSVEEMVKVQKLSTRKGDGLMDLGRGARVGAGAEGPRLMNWVLGWNMIRRMGVMVMMMLLVGGFLWANLGHLGRIVGRESTLHMGLMGNSQQQQTMGIPMAGSSHVQL